MSEAPVPKLVMPLDSERTLSLSPHRFRATSSNLIIIEDEHLRIDLHLSDAQLWALWETVRQRMGYKSPARSA